MISKVTISNSQTGGQHEFTVSSTTQAQAAQYAEKQANAYGCDGIQITPQAESGYSGMDFSMIIVDEYGVL